MAALLFQIDDQVYEIHKELMTSLDLVWLDPEVFSQVIHGRGAPLTKCRALLTELPDPLHDLFITKWHEKRDVKFSSTNVSPEIAPRFVPRKLKGKIEKPFVSDLYTSKMGGVDLADQLPYCCRSEVALSDRAETATLINEKRRLQSKI